MRWPTGRATLTPNSTEPVLRRRSTQSPRLDSSSENSGAPSLREENRTRPAESSTA